MKHLFFSFPALALLSGCHFSVNNPNHAASHRSCCLNAGYKVGTREFDNCLKEQEERAIKQSYNKEKDKVRDRGNQDDSEKLNARE